MANDIQMGEPKADVHAPDMISEAISQPEEAEGQEAPPMAVEAAVAVGATAEATTEAVVEANTESALETTPQATTEATPEAAAEATTTEATPQATTEASTEASAEAKTEGSTEAKTEGSTEAKTETKTAAVADGAEGSHAPSGGDDAVVDEVIDAADEFGGSRVVEREGSENGNYDEPSSRRGRRGRSRSRSRDRVGAGANGDNSRDRGRRRDIEDRERERDNDRSRGRDRDVGNSREHRDRGRDDSRDRNRGGNGGRDRDRGRENSRERDRGRGSSRDRDWSRDERDWGRGRDRDSFDNTRDRGRQSGGHGQGRRDRGPAAPMDGGRAGGREPFRGRAGPPGTGPMMQPMGGGSLPMMQPMGGPGAPMFPPQASAHGQMVFSSNQRPQPMKMAGQTRMYNILPMISFKAFMAEQREDVTPEECKQRYDEYKADYTQRLTHSFIDVHRKEEWLLERYHPKTVQQKKEDKIKWVAQESAVFAEQLRANPVAFIASAALDPISEQQRWGGVDKRKKRPRVSSRDEASMDGMEDDSDQPGESEAKDGSGEYDVDAKEFSAHSDKVVFIRRVPAWISTEELGRQIAVEAPKHERIICSDAANTRNEDFARSAFIIYDTPEKAAKSVQKLNKMRIYQNQKPKAKVSKKVSNSDSKFFELKTFSYKPRTHTAADHDFSDAKRIVHDTKQSLKVAEAMDEEFGRTYMPESIAALLRETEIEEALASSPAGTAELDLVCAYMKRVHLYLYYRGQQCRDEGDMISSRSACRGTEAASKEDVLEAMRVADAEAVATMDGDTPSASGNGAGAGAADNGTAAVGAARGGKKREFGTEYVDECSATRIKDAGKAEERNKKDAALLQRYEARVKEDVETWQGLHTGRTDEGYARCGMPKCAKLFKAAEFVHKHLINKHPEKHKVVVDQATDPFVRELFFADDLKPLPNIVADANTPPVVLLPGAMAMGGSVPAMPPGPPPMGAPGFPMMGGGMPMGPMGPMGPPGQMGQMGDFPMQMQMPPDVMMGSGGRGFRGGRGGGGGGGGVPSFRGRGGGGGGRFGGRGMGRMDNRSVEPIGPRDPRSLVSYIDVDAPKETTPNLDYGDAFPSRPKKKRKTM